MTQTIRVTRSGGSAPLGLLGILQITKIAAKNLGYFFSTESYALIWTKNGATFCTIFSQTHLVILQQF
jgi:hypothetical protein